MTSWLSTPQQRPQATCQVDHAGKITSKEDQENSAGLSTEAGGVGVGAGGERRSWWRAWCLTLMSNWDFFPFSPLKTVMAKQNLMSWSQDKSPATPHTTSFSDSRKFLFYQKLSLIFYLLRNKPPNVSLVMLLLLWSCCWLVLSYSQNRVQSEFRVLSQKFSSFH